MTRLKRRWSALSISTQIMISVALTVAVTVVMVEAVIEPLVEDDIENYAEIDWYEVPVWVVCVCVQAVVGAGLLTRMIMRRLDRLADATKRIARGELSARAVVGTNDRDLFNQVSRNFNTMAETIEQLVVNERRLLSDISHELRSPLARIAAAVELLETDSAADRDRHLRLAEREVRHMNELVGALLKQNRNRLSIREGRETVDASALASELAESFALQGEVERKRLAVSVAPGLFVEGHPVQVRLIMENLLSNAMFYTPPESEIRFGVRQDGGGVRIEVRDGGPGVPEKHLRDIFRAFFRVDSSRSRDSGGLGLGLSLVRDACIALGGNVVAENLHPGLGVTVTLPQSPSPGSG